MAQVFFAKAEAAYRGWIAGGDVEAEAEANYVLGMEMSVRQLNNNSTEGLKHGQNGE